jgi:hypothetical protein
MFFQPLKYEFFKGGGGGTRQLVGDSHRSIFFKFMLKTDLIDVTPHLLACNFR